MFLFLILIFILSFRSFIDSDRRHRLPRSPRSPRSRHMLRIETDGMNETFKKKTTKEYFNFTCMLICNRLRRFSSSEWKNKWKNKPKKPKTTYTIIVVPSQSNAGAGACLKCYILSFKAFDLNILHRFISFIYIFFPFVALWWLPRRQRPVNYAACVRKCVAVASNSQTPSYEYWTKCIDELNLLRVCFHGRSIRTECILCVF